MIGKTVRHYEILEKLGGGGMGEVYKARDLKLDRCAALKFLPPHLNEGEEERQRFVREAKAASALEHNNICTIYGIDETEDGQIFIAMACYEGETLKKKIERGPLEPGKAIDIALQVGRGLAKAHEQQIVHRDIKPANIMITDDGVAKIVDFGLAKFMGHTDLTKSGAMMGTVAYMSPEQAQGESVDHRSDIFSFGAVLYEMLTGQHPFRADHPPAIIYAIIHEDPQPLSGLKAGISDELERIVNKALAKNPDERYQRFEDLIADIEAVWEGSATADAMQAQSSEIAPPGSARRHIFKARTLGFLLLALVVLTFFLRPSSDLIDQKSIAVLPFENMTRDPGNDYFSEGITEDIVAQLSKISELKVISRTSTQRYKDTEKRVPEIGAELGVATILAGSVRREGEHVRIVAQLIDVRSDQHLWAETYDRNMTDIFSIQSDVALQIAAALKAELSSEEKERIARIPTGNLTAYEFYLKGRDFFYGQPIPTFEDATAMFKKALELDPEYALAWAGLGDSYSEMVDKGLLAASWLDSAIAVSEKAIALYPDAAEGYRALALAYLYKGLKDNALKATREAVERSPNSYPDVNKMGTAFMEKGEFAEALPWLLKAAVLNPTLASPRVNIGKIYRLADDEDQAEEWLDSAMEIQPDIAFYELAILHLRQGREREAMDTVLTLLDNDPDNVIYLAWAGEIASYTDEFGQAEQYFKASLANDPDTLYNVSAIGLGHIYWKAGRTEEARELLNAASEARQKLVVKSDASFEVTFHMAALAAIQGDKIKAYTWLQKAMDAGWLDYRLTRRNPWLENLRQEEQFLKLTEKMKKRATELRKRLQATDA